MNMGVLQRLRGTTRNLRKFGKLEIIDEAEEENE